MWYESKGSGGQGLIIEETTGRNVAVSYDEADAPLIAAAPEMLAALKQFVGYCENGNHPAWTKYLKTIAGDKMQSAIAKAEGR